MAVVRRRDLPAADEVSQASVELFAGIEPESSRRILLAAIAAFRRRGFHAATTREISEAAGMSPAAVYVHYAAKSDLLFEISRLGHQSVLDQVEQALRDGPADPEARVRRFVATFARWHADHHVVARVIQYELKALPTRQFRAIARVRKRFEELLGAELRAGSATGAFEITDLDATTLAILSLCIDLARWYLPGEDHKTSAEVGELYADLVARMVLPRAGASIDAPPTRSSSASRPSSGRAAADHRPGQRPGAKSPSARVL